MSNSQVEALIASLPKSVLKFDFMPNYDLEHMLVLLLNCTVQHVETDYDDDFPNTEELLNGYLDTNQ